MKCSGHEWSSENESAAEVRACSPLVDTVKLPWATVSEGSDRHAEAPVGDLAARAN